jgi:AraC-like DNA-binding protein
VLPSPDLPAPPEQLVPVVVRRPGTAVYPAGSRFGPRLLDDFELVLVVTGSAQVELDDHRETLLPGSWVLSRPGMRDSYWWDPQRLCRHLYVHFELDPRLDAAGWPHVRHWPAEAGLEAEFRRLVWLGSTPDGGDPTGDRATAARLTVADLLATFLGGAVPSSDPAPDADPPVARAVTHVQQRWERDGLVQLSRDELAAAAGVSVAHLSRLFRQDYGLGPSRALEWVRLRRALVLLSRGSMSVREIALAVGYVDQYHFSRRFRETFDLSPTGFREAPAAVQAAVPFPPGLVRLEEVLSAGADETLDAHPVLDYAGPGGPAGGEVER